MWLWLWSFARVEFGMGEREFYRLSFRQFDALRNRLREQQERRDGLMEYMLAQVVAMQANTGFRGWKEWKDVEDFMPSARRRLAEEREAETPDDVADRIREQMFLIMKSAVVH